MNYYISDLHFGHKNVISYDNRPFKDVEEMNEVLIKNWNNKVEPTDTVYILGDFSWLNKNKTAEILKKLAGKKILIKGNHDELKPVVAEQFEAIYDYLEIEDDGEKLVLSHYPMPFWDGQSRDAVHLYGHVHNSHQWKFYEKFIEYLIDAQGFPMRTYNVGCMMDYMEYTPQSLKHILNQAKN